MSNVPKLFETASWTKQGSNVYRIHELYGLFISKLNHGLHEQFKNFFPLWHFVLFRINALDVICSCLYIYELFMNFFRFLQCLLVWVYGHNSAFYICTKCNTETCSILLRKFRIVFHAKLNYKGDSNMSCLKTFHFLSSLPYHYSSIFENAELNAPTDRRAGLAPVSYFLPCQSILRPPLFYTQK